MRKLSPLWCLDKVLCPPQMQVTWVKRAGAPAAPGPLGWVPFCQRGKVPPAHSGGLAEPRGPGA